MFTFAAAVFFLIITPGPGVLTTAGVGSGFGYRPGVRYVAGLCLGNNLVTLVVVSGLAAIVLAEPVIKTILVLASAAYLLYLALRIAFAGSKIAFMERARPPGVMGGITLQLINPKAYAVATALFGGHAFWPENPLGEMLIKFAVMNAIWIPIHLGWLAAGVTLHRLDLSARSHRIINILMALSMLAVVGLTAWSQA